MVIGSAGLKIAYSTGSGSSHYQSFYTHRIHTIHTVQSANDELFSQNHFNVTSDNFPIPTSIITVNHAPTMSIFLANDEIFIV